MSINKIEISDKTIVRSIVWVLFFYALFYFKSLILVLFLSVVLASISNRFATLLKKIKVPRYLSVIFFYLFSLSFLFFIIYNFLPSSIRYVGNVINTLPELLNSFKNLNLTSSAWYSNFLSYLINYVSSIDVNLLSEKIRSWILNTSIASSGSAINIIANFFMTIIISFYISMSQDGVQNFIRLVTPKKYEEYMISLFARVERKISSWFLGQVIVAFIVGLVIYILLLLFKIPFALPIAFLAFVFEILPILGTTIASIPAVFFAWNIGGLSLSLIILLSFFLISQISSYFLYPKIVGKFVGFPTVVILIAIFIGATMGGFWGALVAIPVSTIVMEILEDLKVLKEKDN